MKVENMSPMEVTDFHKDKDGYINPFKQDAFHMGTPLGKNVLVMHTNFPSNDARYLIVIDTKTGERIRIVFE